MILITRVYKSGHGNFCGHFEYFVIDENHKELYRSYYLEECESYCDEHNMDCELQLD